MSDKTIQKLNIDYERLGAAIARHLSPVNVNVQVSTLPNGEDWDKAIDQGLGDALDRARARNVSPLSSFLKDSADVETASDIMARALNKIASGKI